MIADRKSLAELGRQILEPERRDALKRFQRWFPFDPDGIWEHGTDSGGIYIIRPTGRDAHPIYIGKARDVEERLTRHLQADEPQGRCIKQHGGDWFAYRVVSGEASRQKLERYLIDLFDPVCNRTH